MIFRLVLVGNGCGAGMDLSGMGVLACFWVIAVGLLIDDLNMFDIWIIDSDCNFCNNVSGL